MLDIQHKVLTGLQMTFIFFEMFPKNILSPVIQLISTIVVVLSTKDWFSAGVFFLYILVFVIFNTRLTGSLASLRKHNMDITLNSYSLLSDTVDNMIAAKKNNALRLISERYEDALTQENNAPKKNTVYSVLKFFIELFTCCNIIWFCIHI